MPKIIIEVPEKCWTIIDGIDKECEFYRYSEYKVGRCKAFCNWPEIIDNNPCQQCLDARAEAANILEAGEV